MTHHTTDKALLRATLRNKRPITLTPMTPMHSIMIDIARETLALFTVAAFIGSAAVFLLAVNLGG